VHFKTRKGAKIMNECLTIPFLQEFSGCLVENPVCRFAARCGFSYHCEHPNHKEFHRKDPTPDERAELLSRYKELKESRRRKYMETAEKNI
jgi:hypothetical protein